MDSPSPRPSRPEELVPHAHKVFGAEGETMLVGPFPINFWKSIRKNRAYRAEYNDRIKRPATRSPCMTPPRSYLLCRSCVHGEIIASPRRPVSQFVKIENRCPALHLK